MQEKYGEEKVIVLKGNHEQRFLDWLNDYRNPYPDGTEDDIVFNDWLCSDLECGFNTISTFLPQWQMDFLNQITRTCSIETLSREVVQIIEIIMMFIMMEKVITILMDRSIMAGNYCCWHMMKRMGNIFK